MELKYSTQIDSAKIKAAADLNKIILTNENHCAKSTLDYLNVRKFR